MTSTQQNIGQSGADGLAALVGGVTNFSRKAQEIVGELTKFSEKNVGAGVNAAERLRSAKTLQDVTTIQIDLMRDAYETMSTHSRKIAEITASTPSELTKSYLNVFSALSAAGSEFAQKVTEMTRSMGEKGSSAFQQMGGQATNAAGQNAKTKGSSARA
jgi:hypothetical protein